ncbi:MAG: hypothetical protein KC560_13815 [Myxococcales bacterium]|nr:hypothetical protein [Myxococcales bacterium]
MSGGAAPTFRALGATPNAAALVPTIEIALAAESVGDRDVYAIALRAELLLDARAARFPDEARRRLDELFGGPPARVPWARVDALVPSFRGATRFDLAVPCGGLDATVAKLFHAADDAAVPVVGHLSGTVFYAADGGRLQLERLPWDREIALAIPAAVWRAARRAEEGGEHWVALSPATLSRLRRFVDERGLASPDAAVDALLAQAVGAGPGRAA